MKIVINRCYGGYGLSMKALYRLAELQGKPCFFFHTEYQNGRESAFLPIQYPLLGEQPHFICFAFDVEDPEAILGGKQWQDMSREETIAHNRAYEKHTIDNMGNDRANPLLVQVVEELGREADGQHAKLEVIEVPNNIEWEIDEYDGIERINEKHRSWG